MLFSVLDAGGQIAGQAVSPQGSTVFRTPGDSTSQILQDTQNIRPIVRVNQGTALAITAAKDFDFSQVYGLGSNERTDPPYGYPPSFVSAPPPITQDRRL